MTLSSPRHLSMVAGQRSCSAPPSGAGAAARDAGGRLPYRRIARRVPANAAAFHKDLKESVYVEGRSVVTQSRWTAGRRKIPPLFWPMNLPELMYRVRLIRAWERISTIEWLGHRIPNEHSAMTRRA